ncbi:MAG: pre-peptidase C-terminal domain-containing protein [Anaerolineae bacterium]
MLAAQPRQKAPRVGQRQATAAAPDLIIAGITLTPADPGPGGTADIEVVVKNQGDEATAVVFNLYLYVEPAEEPPTQSTAYTSVAGYGLPLPPGGSFTYTRTGQIFNNTPPKVYAWVDPPWENSVAESDEDNNLFPQVTSGGDSYEDDDTCANAKEITPDGTVQDRNLYRDPDSDVGDVDWIKFNGVGGVTYLAEAIALGADASLTIELHDRCDGPPSFGTGAKIEFTAPADGTFYVKVSHNQLDYGPDNAYQFKVTSDGGCTNHLEPDNACTLSGDLSLNTTQTHTFCKAGDADWMRFAVTAGAQYRVVSTNVGQNANVKLNLYMSCDDANSTSSGETLEFTAPEAGHVYIKAEQIDSTVYGAGTDYTLRAERLSTDGCTEDSFEQDDNAADAKTLDTDGSPQARNICPADDSDWVKFSAYTGTTYNIETLNLAAAADTVLCLHASNGDQIACDDDSGAGKGSRLIWSPPTSGDYLLHIKDLSSTVAGDETTYDLRINQGLCQTDAFEEDDSRDEARVVTPNNTATSHNFCPSDDHDWVAFNATSGTSYIIETTDPGPEADTIVEIYDANGALLAQNDDHTPGTSSQVAFTPASAGNYFVKIRQYNPTYFGAGTEYGVRIRQGTPTPTPTVTVTPTPTPTPTPNPSSVGTLILVNRARLAQLHGDNEASDVMDKLDELAQHPRVRGEIIRLDKNSEVSTAYAAWTTDQGKVEKANQVTTAIRNVVMTYLQQRSGVEYLVLVGDDRALPMRRILDTTPRFSENAYKHTNPNNPTGAALKDNYYLSDDYFADREPTVHKGRELFIPDLAVGRLIESPSEMIGQIEAFLANPVTVVDNILVSGYDFVQDVATEDCEDWKTDFGAPKVNCDLIGETWTGDGFRSLQLRTTSPFKIQSISGHATHYAEGAPVGSAILAQDVKNTAFDLSGGLIFTPGCHAGLNVPPNNPDNPIDLPQAFVSKRANYIGNTGYGWGMRSSIGLSEKLIRLNTRALLQGTESSMGKALVTAKTLYYKQDQDFSSYDEKVMQQVVFYGLPMYELETGSVLSGPGNDFPGVNFMPSLPSNPLGGSVVLTGSVTIDFQQAENLALSETNDGDYYTLNGSMHTVPGQPIQPLHFGDVTAPQLPARGALLLSASFQVQENFDPVIAVPYNEYDTGNIEPELENPLGLYPPVPVSIQQHNGESSLVTQLGQYDAATGDLRLLQNVQVEIYYSTEIDQLSPEATVIDGITRSGSDTVEVKVGAVDASGIERVVVSYIQDISQSANQLKSTDLSYDSAAQKWIGSFHGDANSRYLVQIVDKAGNITTATNKGQYYKPGQVQASGPTDGCTGECVFLPLISR